jgi:hypothetical protein
VALFFSIPLSSSPLVPEFSDGQDFSELYMVMKKVSL